MAGALAAPSGFLVIDKPAGITSFDVIRELRRTLGIRKLGHSGVLDKPATGVLVIGANRATRLFELFGGFEKDYRAHVWLGLATATDDLAGELLSALGPGELARERVEEALGAFHGEIMQQPPAFSLAKKDGRELYRYALAGVEVEVEPKRVEVHELALTSFAPEQDVRDELPQDSKLAGLELPLLACVGIELTCSGGLYVRSLARDLGGALGVGGTLGRLVRTRVGPFTLAQAVPLAGMAEAAAQRGGAAGVLMPLSTIAPEEARLYLDKTQLEFVRHGRSVRRFKHLLPPAAQSRGDLVYAVAPDGELAAVLSVASVDPHGLVELRPSLVLG